MKPETYLRLALSIAAATMVVWLAAWRTFFRDTLLSSFLAIAIVSLLLILLRTRAAWKEIAGVAGLTAIMALMDVKVLGYPAKWQMWASFLGLAAFIVLVLRVIWFKGAQRRTAIYTVVPAFLFVASEWCADYFLAWTQQAHPKVLDLYLYSFDASLHVQIPFLMGQLFARAPWLMVVSILFYIGLPVAIGLTFAGCLVSDRRNALPAFLAFLLTGPVGALFYNLFPALGPVHIFRGLFPWHPLGIDQASRLHLDAVAAAGARNAIPSLHAAWIYLVFWYSRKLSIAERIVAVLFVVFTLFATVGTGEHYFIDLVVAVPFSLFTLALSRLFSERRREVLYFPLITGLGITLGWFVALRYGISSFWISPILPWAACVVTVAASYFAGRPLLGSESGQPSTESPMTEKLEEIVKDKDEYEKAMSEPWRA